MTEYLEKKVTGTKSIEIVRDDSYWNTAIELISRLPKVMECFLRPKEDRSDLDGG